MKRLTVLVAAAAAAVVALALVASGGTAQQPGERTFKLIEDEGDFALIDNPPLSKAG